MATTAIAPAADGCSLPTVMAASREAGVGVPELVALAAAGDVQAFEELYRANVGRVYALCLRMSGDSHLAEELVQESFVRAWRKLPSFRGASAFSTWLHRVTVNVVLGQRRSASSRARGSASPAATEPEQAVSAVSPGEAIDLERAIAALPDRAREVFVLHDVEGFRHEEIARLTGIAVGTSKAQLHRARRILRKALAP